MNAHTWLIWSNVRRAWRAALPCGPFTSEFDKAHRFTAEEAEALCQRPQEETYQFAFPGGPLKGFSSSMRAAMFARSREELAELLVKATEHEAALTAHTLELEKRLGHVAKTLRVVGERAERAESELKFEQPRGQAWVEVFRAICSLFPEAYAATNCNGQTGVQHAVDTLDHVAAKLRGAQLDAGERKAEHALAASSVLKLTVRAAEQERALSGLSAFLPRIQDYLQLGGLFNPEMMEHDKVSSLLQDLCIALRYASVADKGINKRDTDGASGAVRTCSVNWPEV